MAALGRYGINRRRLAELAEESLRKAGDISTATELFKDVDLLGDLANEWTESEPYVDRAGRPRVLTIEGPGATFETLVGKYFGNRSFKQILDFGCKTKILEKVGPDKVAQFGGCVIFAGHPTLMLAHAIHSIRCFLSTTIENADCPDLGTSPLPDRRACMSVPEKAFPDFVQAMRLPIIGLVEMGNRWLAAQAHSRRGKAITAGVHAYLFRDPMKTGAGGRRGRRISRQSRS